MKFGWGGSRPRFGPTTTEKNGVRHNVTIQRLYTDEEGHWQTSTSFGRDDLPLVAKVADLAHTWIFEEGQGHDDSQPNDEAAHY